MGYSPEEAQRAANPSVPNGVISTVPDPQIKPVPSRRQKISGLVSLISLVACVALPVWMSLHSGADYQARLPLFKILLLVVSLVYLIVGTIWLVEREKNESPQQCGKRWQGGT